MYSTTSNDPLVLTTYINASWNNCKNVKSVIRLYYLLTDGVVTWLSKKQSIVMHSSVETKYSILSIRTKNMIWFCMLLSKIDFAQPSTIFYVNK